MNPDSLQTFKDFLTTTIPQIPLLSFVTNLILAGVLAFALSRIYLSYGDSLSNRTLFSRNFLMITMTTMLIISIVKSSLALSLGLVGALSIVRFRAAIKEPEELTYLFLAIGIGLGFGADQGLVTIVAFAVIVGVLMIRKRFLHKSEDSQNLHLTVYSHNPKKVELGQVLKTLRDHCLAVDLRRFDESKEVLEASFLIEYRDFEQLDETKSALQKLDDSIKITFLDNTGVV